MSSIEWLNNLMFMENLLGVYRNYNNMQKIEKYFTILQLFSQNILHAMILIGQLYFLLGRSGFTHLSFSFCCISASSYTNAVSAVITSVSSSHAFLSYLRSVSRVSEWFKDDKKLITSLKIFYWCSIVFIIFCFMFTILRGVDIQKTLPINIDLTILVPVLVSQTCLRMIVVFQHFMLFVVIMIIVYLFKSLNSLVSVIQQRVGSCQIITDGYITSEQIQGWVEVYRDLANCCEKVALCFGLQFIFSLILSVTHYIWVAYQMCYMSILKIDDSDEFKKMVFIIFSFASLLMLPLIAGQLARNQGVKLHRGLARLYNTMIIESGNAEAKLVKDFIRLIKKSPIEIKLLSKLPAGMYLLPVILTLAVNYLIFMLQLNHIV